ncbi:Putative membrane protein [Clostridium neonatale]|nr:Putative membrane protein [Clostridium neonatale]
MLSKKGDYSKAYDYIEKALKIDCNDKEAIRIQKELIDFGGYKLKKKSSKKIILSTILFITIIIICSFITLFMRNNYENLFNNKSSNNLITSNDKEKNLNKENSDSRKQDKKMKWIIRRLKLMKKCIVMKIITMIMRIQVQFLMLKR